MEKNGHYKLIGCTYTTRVAVDATRQSHGAKAALFGQKPTLVLGRDEKKRVGAGGWQWMEVIFQSWGGGSKE